MFSIKFVHLKHLNSWVRCISGNSTIVVPVSAHFNVALLTPGCSPTVLNNPEVLALVSSITHSQNSMVKLGWRTYWLIVHSFLVQLKNMIIFYLVLSFFNLKILGFEYNFMQRTLSLMDWSPNRLKNYVFYKQKWKILSVVIFCFSLKMNNLHGHGIFYSITFSQTLHIAKKCFVW